MSETIPKSRLDEMVARAREEAAYLDGRSGFTGPLSVITTLRDSADAIEELTKERAELMGEEDSWKIMLSNATVRAEMAESSLASVTAERDALREEVVATASRYARLAEESPDRVEDYAHDLPAFVRAGERRG